MPTWGEELLELQELQREDQRKRPVLGAATAFDRLRRKYLLELHNLTGRAVIAYETAFLEARPMHPDTLTIHLGDVTGFMEAVSNITERELDLILHSPGGSAEAAESIVDYLRTRFDHIRVFVPLAAMSAATMMSLAADEIVMGAHSQLGPIDPQFTLQTPKVRAALLRRRSSISSRWRRPSARTPRTFPRGCPSFVGTVPGFWHSAPINGSWPRI